MPQMPEDNKGPAAPQLSKEEKRKFSDLAKFLSRAVWQTQAFGIAHPMAKQPLEQCFTLLNSLVQEKGNIILYVAEKKLRYAETILEENNPVVDRLVELFSTMRLSSLEFERGFSHEDFLGLLGILVLRPQDIQDAGGIEVVIKQKNISRLKLNTVKYELIGMDKKVVSETAQLIEGDLQELEKKLAQWSAQSDVKEEEAEEPEEDLLSLIDLSLREETEQSVFVDKLLHDPLEEVHLIIEAIRKVNKVGGEKARAIIGAVTGKLDRVRDDLYMYLEQGREDENTEYTYRAAEILVKELSRQIKTIKAAPDLSSAIDEMNSVLTMIMDQTEARKLFSTLLKGEMTLKKKAAILKKIMQREKVSADFEFLMRKLLALKDMPPEEISRLFDEKATILELAEKEKEDDLAQEFKPTLQKLSAKQIDMDEAVSALNELISQSVEAKMKLTTQKLQIEHERLMAQTQAFNAAFADIDEGVMVFDAGGKVVFLNGPAQRLLGLQVDDKIEGQLLRALQNWQTDKSEIGAEKAGEFSKILSCLKVIRKSDKGELNIAIFKPGP